MAREGCGATGCQRAAAVKVLGIGSYRCEQCFLNELESGELVVDTSSKYSGDTVTCENDHTMDVEDVDDRGIEHRCPECNSIIPQRDVKKARWGKNHE